MDQVIRKGKKGRWNRGLANMCLFSVSHIRYIRGNHKSVKIQAFSRQITEDDNNKC